jgi:hypothetical protein
LSGIFWDEEIHNATLGTLLLGMVVVIALGYHYSVTYQWYRDNGGHYNFNAALPAVRAIGYTLAMCLSLQLLPATRW